MANQTIHFVLAVEQGRVVLKRHPIVVTASSVSKVQFSVSGANVEITLAGEFLTSATIDGVAAPTKIVVTPSAPSSVLSLPTDVSLVAAMNSGQIRVRAWDFEENELIVIIGPPLYDCQ